MTLIKIHSKILWLAIFRSVRLNTDYYKVTHKCMTRKLSTIRNKLRAVKRNKINMGKRTEIKNRT